MAIELYEHQKSAIEKMRSGCILVGGVGSGKSRAAIAYYFIKECGGKIKINGVGGYSPMKNPKDLYIITTAKKRDEHDWEDECKPFLLNDVKVSVDSWNNIMKYLTIQNAFFIFDEQRVIGSGAWAKSFLKITNKNRWVLLSATPGDTWLDYIPVFIANGWYKNRSEFIRRHVVYNRMTRFPKVERYLEIPRLVSLRNAVTVPMRYVRKTIAHEEIVTVPFDQEVYNTVMIQRWNVYEHRPVKDVSELCYLLRRVVNSDPRRLATLKYFYEKHQKLVVFYNFNYEKDLILEIANQHDILVAQWNGHKHEPIPKKDKWIYLVQYSAGAEGWNCIETNVIIFFSRNYSYRAMTQAAGRIDRSNTPFQDLYYYHLVSNSIIDLGISKSLSRKQNFNESRFMSL